MTIRSTVKAIIIQDDKILLQCCWDDKLKLDYYELPGGGQLPMEKMEDALIRECLEETGYHVAVIRFFGVAEEIITVDPVSRDYLDHLHRIFHIFLCRIKNVPQGSHSEEDPHQIDVRWFPINEVPSLRLRPPPLRSALIPLLKSGEPGYLGTYLLADFNE